MSDDILLILGWCSGGGVAHARPFTGVAVDVQKYCHGVGGDVASIGLDFCAFVSFTEELCLAHMSRCLVSVCA